MALPIPKVLAAGAAKVGLTRGSRFRKLWPIFAAALVALSIMALTNGPEHSADAQNVTNDGGITHTSYVHYSKTTNPFVANVDRVYYGGRPPGDLSEEWQFDPKWRREVTHYVRWNGSQWAPQLTRSSTEWRDCGSPGSLCWWNLHNDVTLNDSAAVFQKLKYKYLFFNPGEGLGAEVHSFSWSGYWHRHFLE